MSIEHRRKLSLAKLGDKNPRFGVSPSKYNLQQIRLAQSGENNKLWKGDDVGYHGLHKWVRRHLPQPKLCEFCNVNDSKHLANITGNYARPLYNWRYLCCSCHKKFDIMNKKLFRSIK